VTGKFIPDGHDALSIGSPGTGKSHIAKTVANSAILSGYKVVYREAHSLFEDLFEATQLKRRKNMAKLFSETDLLVIDDLFLRPWNDINFVAIFDHSSYMITISRQTRPLRRLLILDILCHINMLNQIGLPMSTLA